MLLTLDFLSQPDCNAKFTTNLIPGEYSLHVRLWFVASRETLSGIVRLTVATLLLSIFDPRLPTSNSQINIWLYLFNFNFKFKFYFFFGISKKIPRVHSWHNAVTIGCYLQTDQSPVHFASILYFMANFFCSNAHTDARQICNITSLTLVGIIMKNKLIRIWWKKNI